MADNNLERAKKELETLEKKKEELEAKAEKKFQPMFAVKGCCGGLVIGGILGGIAGSDGFGLGLVAGLYYFGVMGLQKSKEDTLIELARVEKEFEEKYEEVNALENGMEIVKESKPMTGSEKEAEEKSAKFLEQAFTLSDHGNTQGALKAIEDGLKLAKHPHTKSNFEAARCQVYRDAKELDKAIAAGKKALEIEETNGLAMGFLASAYEDKGDFENAILHIQNAVTIGAIEEESLKELKQRAEEHKKKAGTTEAKTEEKTDDEEKKTKKCPYCQEEIYEKCVKCPVCGGKL